MRPTPILVLAEAMMILSRDIASDLSVVLPLLGSAALFASRRNKGGLAIRAAHDRLAAEVLA